MSTEDAPSLEKVSLYHPEIAPKGRTFYADEPPSDAGWVDSPSKFPNWKAPPEDQEPYRLPPRDPPHETYRYHITQGGRVFMSDDLPSEAQGWFDSPTKAKTCDPESVVLRENSISNFVEDYLELHGTPGMSAKEIMRIKKLGLKKYAADLRGQDIDMRESYDDIVKQIEVML